MSREYKFRVYIKETSKYVYFSLGDFDYSKRVANNQSDIPIEQFTGMMDKYNQPIYEGDVIRGIFDFGPAGFKEEILPVDWNNERGYQWDYWRLMTIEVLGNEHEWPCHKPKAFDHNSECLTCDAWATQCPFLKFYGKLSLLDKLSSAHKGCKLE
jgi:hypothetical protein